MGGVKSAVLFSAILLLGSSCKKSIEDTQIVSVSGSGTSKDGVPNYPFNWETSQQMMPYSPTINATYNPYMPWSSQGGSPIDAGIISDHNSSDGWVLVYNTFNPNNYGYITAAGNGGLYFALYNIYRGILRYYLYLPSGNNNGGSDIEHGLSIYSGTGATTSMLNFDGADIVDPATNVKSFTKTNNVGIASGGGWYAMQYEIAYDPNFQNAVAPNLAIAWNSRIINIATIQIAGQTKGTITGDITQQSSGFNWASSLINGGLSAAEIYTTAITWGGGNQFWKAMSSAAGNGLAGNITGFLSGIFGGNSSNPQEVDLKMNTTDSLQGTIITPYPANPNWFVFPGESIAANNNGTNPPLYASPQGISPATIPSLGVFNLTARPTVYAHSTPVILSYDYRRLVTTYNIKSTFTFDKTMAATLAINPAVTSAANVSIKSAQLIVVPTSGQLVSTDGTLQTIGSFSGYFNPTQMTEGTWKSESDISTIVGTFSGQAYIELTLTITPNNGAPASSISKTFLANVVQN